MHMHEQPARAAKSSRSNTQYSVPRTRGPPSPLSDGNKMSETASAWRSRIRLKFFFLSFFSSPHNSTMTSLGGQRHGENASPTRHRTNHLRLSEIPSPSFLLPSSFLFSFGRPRPPAAVRKAPQS